MIGQKAKIFKVHPGLTPDDLVPQDNFSRQVEAKLDLSFVRELGREHYALNGVNLSDSRLANKRI